MTDIQWFPGHMHKAYRAISRLIRDIDVVVEILDARIPHSSSNPLLNSIICNTKTIKLLNKSDLANKSMTAKWISRLKNKNTIALEHSKFDKHQKLINACKSLAPNRNSFVKPLRIMVSGIPNVGKSTLINKLSGKHSAKTGDIPALTRGILTLNVADDVIIYDTPGLTWHKFDEQTTGYNLALCNSIGRNALDVELLALYLIEYMLSHHRDTLMKCYKINENDTRPEKILEQLSYKFGAIRHKTQIDIHKISEIVIQDFRSGKLGAITLESL